MIVPGPLLIEEIKTDAGKKFYDRVQKDFPVELWGITLVSILDIEDEFKLRIKPVRKNGKSGS